MEDEPDGDARTKESEADGDGDLVGVGVFVADGKNASAQLLAPKASQIPNATPRVLKGLNGLIVPTLLAYFQAVSGVEGKPVVGQG
jgi:hypothetical protein